MRRIALFSLWLVLAGGCDKATTPSFEGATQATHTIFELKNLCTADSYPITSDITLLGQITADDLYGEFYKTLVVEDTSGGIAIAVNSTALADNFPVGCAVQVRCNGLTLCEYGGKIMLGTTPDAYGAGRIALDDLPRYLRRTHTETARKRPATFTFNEITFRQIDTYIRFDGIRFTTSGNWCDVDPETRKPVTTEHTIADSAGKLFCVRVLGTCDYASEPVPEGTGSLCGIIDYFNGKYSLRVVNREVEFATFATYPTACLSAAGCSVPTPTR